MNFTRAVRAKRPAGRWMFSESCGRETQVIGERDETSALRWAAAIRRSPSAPSRFLAALDRFCECVLAAPAGPRRGLLLEARDLCRRNWY